MLRGPVVFVLLIGLHHGTSALSFAVEGLDCDHLTHVISGDSSYKTRAHSRIGCMEGMEYCQLRSSNSYGSPTNEAPVQPNGKSLMGFDRKIMNTEKLLAKMDTLFLKLLLLFVLRLLVKGTNSVELYVASIALFHTDVLSAGLTPISSAGSTVTYSRGECDKGWIQVNTSCYLPVTEPMPFNDAARECVFHAATMVTISNHDENSLIFNIARDFLADPGVTPVWIGLERMDMRMRWIDGTSLKYKNWFMGEPDANGACVQMALDAFWEDNTCLQKLKFICEKPSFYPPPYSRSTELALLIGIPLTFSTIMLCGVAILLCKSIKDSDGTFFAYGKNRNREIMHATLVNVTASIAHIRAQRGFDATDPETTKPQAPTCNNNTPGTSAEGLNSQTGSPEGRGLARRNSETSARSETGEEIEMQICASTTSIEQEPKGFQSTTSLDYLLSQSFITQKSRKLRAIKNVEATVRPAGRSGVYRKKDSFRKMRKGT